MASNGWFWVVGALYVGALVLSRPPVWRAVVRRLDEPTRALRDRLTASPPPAPEVVALFQLVRRERLVADLRRVERVLADDEWMSATRQVANRMARDQLLADLRAPLPGVDPPVPGSARDPLLAPDPAPLRWVGPATPAPVVEVLDLGWRPAR